MTSCGRGTAVVGLLGKMRIPQPVAEWLLVVAGWRYVKLVTKRFLTTSWGILIFPLVTTGFQMVADCF